MKKGEDARKLPEPLRRCDRMTMSVQIASLTGGAAMPPGQVNDASEVVWNVLLSHGEKSPGEEGRKLVLKGKFYDVFYGDIEKNWSTFGRGPPRLFRMARLVHMSGFGWERLKNEVETERVEEREEFLVRTLKEKGISDKIIQNYQPIVQLDRTLPPPGRSKGAR